MGRVRTFLAVDVGDAVRASATRLQKQLAETGAGVKWVTAENFHVTLQFLGEVDDRDLMTVCRAVAKVAGRHDPFGLTIAGVGAFPTLRRPKVVWGGVAEGSDSLRKLFAALEPPLVELGVYRPEERGYTPHLTLGRVRGEADGQTLATVLPSYLAWKGGQAVVNEVLVMGSELGRDGPEYAVLSRAPLGGAG